MNLISVVLWGSVLNMGSHLIQEIRNCFKLIVGFIVYTRKLKGREGGLWFTPPFQPHKNSKVVIRKPFHLDLLIDLYYKHSKYA